ncbi:hypothetical protein EDD76_102343 [Kineothrix alysoides]|uniref:Uncharacterized protein n=1 Tax=Kineothrix alysoides TaxID=1469948 RepID=A0A4R1R561_9FIRM|nr:hypothetical protein [Kineothrix alysoides]TCL60644.1 hypothetical protein EDD76_102343 [Kineothrix alysoides]
MGLIKKNKLFQKVSGWKAKRDVRLEEYEDANWMELEYDRKSIQVHDSGQRQDYIKAFADQIADAKLELENLNLEYNTVTSYLKDMEEIEALPEEEMRELKASAEKIDKLENERGVYLGKKNRMSDERFHQVERIEKEAQEACRKLASAEEDQNRIKQDMFRLDGEKHAYLYRKDELRNMIADSRGMAIICGAAFVVCFAVLLVLQYGMDMDTQLGFLLTAGIAALVITLLYLRHTEAIKELKKVEAGINRIIQLQNRVKIRYVNNTNLLDYLYLKYQVSSAKEMSTLWEKYKIEKEERKSYRQAELELDDCQQELLNILKCYQIKDPAIWLHQTAAILDSKEMVEIRHSLIIRRQSLRRRIDYNKEVIIAGAQNAIKDMADSYPQYAREIKELTDRFGDI